MQTIRRETHQPTIDDRTLELLQKPVEEIDLPFLRDAVKYLRSTVVQEISDIVRPLGSTAIDVAGTGGSGIVKFNTSTAISFVLAAHGVDVIKFGNRSITGTSGSLDFLSAIGCLKNVSASDMERVFKSTNLLFLSAPSCYPNLAAIRDTRKKINKPTIFNFIGPLLNPAQPAYRLFGISNSYMHLLVNQLIKTDGSTKRAVTAHSTIRSGSSVIEVDELLPYTLNTATLIQQTIGGDYKASVSILEIPPTASKNQAVSKIQSSEIQTSPNSHSMQTSELNARIFLDILDGNDTSSTHFQGIILNAGAAFVAAGAVSSLDEGIRLTQNLIANNSVSRKLAQVRRTLS